MRRCGSRITAAATTGPANGPRPASSTPAIRYSSTIGPTFLQKLQNALRGAIGGADTQLLVHPEELRVARVAPGRIVELQQQCPAQVLPVDRFLQELRHQRL